MQYALSPSNLSGNDEFAVLNLASPDLDPILHPTGTLHLLVAKDGDLDLDPDGLNILQRRSLEDYLGRQAEIRGQLELLLLRDRHAWSSDDAEDDDESAGAAVNDQEPSQGDIWQHLRVTCLVLYATATSALDKPTTLYSLELNVLWGDRPSRLFPFKNGRLQETLDYGISYDILPREPITINDPVFGTLFPQNIAEAMWIRTLEIPYFKDFGEACRQTAIESPDDPDLPPPQPRTLTKRQLDSAQQLEEYFATLPPEARAMLKGATQKQLDQSLAAPEPDPQPSPDKLDPLHIERVVHEKKILLHVWVGESQLNTPSRPQQDAWSAVLARGDALWDEVIRKIRDIYTVQQPFRAKWWKAIYGDYQLARALPESPDDATFQKLIQPIIISIREEVPGAVEVRIQFLCRWNDDGLAIVIRDASVLGIAGNADILINRDPAAKTLHDPVFGHIRRSTVRRPWKGYVRCDPFLNFVRIAEQRASFRENHKRHGRPQSLMRWELASGTFEISIDSSTGGPPTPDQQQAFASFQKNETAFADQILHAIFQRYVNNFKANRAAWVDRYLEDLIPDIHDPSGLHDLLQLVEIHVWPEQKSAPITIAFDFVCSWDLDGLAVLWQDGKLLGIGNSQAAKPLP